MYVSPLQRGISIIEVLTALLVFGVGVVGALALQTHSAADAKFAYHTAQASNLAFDLGERFRGNPVARDIFINANWSGNGAVSTAEACLNKDVGDASVAVCSADQMAAADIDEIKILAANLLPQGRVWMGAVECAPQVCVRVAWGGVNPESCVENGATDSCVQLTFQ